ITLAYEILVHSLSPLERALWETSHAKQVRARAPRLARGGDPTIRSRPLVAACAITLPVALMGVAPPPPPPRHAAPRTAARHVTEVKRVVKVERRTVAMAARPTTTGVKSAAATPEPPATTYKHPVDRTTGTTKRSDTKHTTDNTTSDSTPSTDAGSTADDA